MKKETFIIWFVIIPLFLLGFHIGIIITNIFTNFSFEIPLIFKISGVLSGLWIWITILLLIYKRF